MIRTTLALLALLASGCVTQAPFTVVIENTDTETRFVGTGMNLVDLSKEFDGEWRQVTESKAMLCAEQCGVPGQIVCAAFDFAPTVFELAPGESTTVEFDGDGWVLTDMQCLARVSHAGASQLRVCHSDEAEFFEEGGGGDGFHMGSLIDPICDEQEIEIEGGDEIVLELAAE